MMNEEEKKEAKRLFDKLLAVLNGRVELEVILRERSEILKYEVAVACNIQGKDGEIQGNKVKMPIVLAVCEELEKGKNKIAENFDIMEDYKNALTKKVAKDLLDSFLTTKNEIDDTKLDYKEAFKDCTLLSKEQIKAIELLVKEKYEEIKSDAMTNAGFESNKPQKNNSEINEIKEELAKILK
ncbi:hypothetical protein CFT12S00416_07950 [Campylobacter fetus subsp. testudinum]|uniref:hypothetical protein n=1 Tax=Campylobacter fetus TaxID=196 RepID=UPI000818BC87|nr:hypothetical protein [Campylobacter fetus]OCR87750.1 hypothetical protein CFT12S00416_07950 [Campylobacter fetus subsp. testudinum]OCR99076.1 hypothetical protein A9K75_08495 [Campylobacter fetus subsp. testudinum]